MVTFKLKEKSDTELVYWYFPHGKEANGHGTIVVDRVTPKVDVTELAPNDRITRHTVEEQMKIRQAAINMRKIEQLPELTEEEWPTPTQERYSTIFADHAVNKIVNAYNAGQILEDGVETWEQ